MGLIRLLLAVTIVITHAGPLYGLMLTDGYIALKIFFIISGFFMGLILTEKYTGEGRYTLFISNRLLRLFPAYWVILVISVLCAIVSHFALGSWLNLSPWAAMGATLDPVSKTAVVAANVAIIGQDALYFTFVNPESGTLVFSLDALTQRTPAWVFLAIPQTWAISLEVMFYLIAPFLAKRRLGVLIALCVVFFTLRYGLISIESLPLDPWKQRFFPAEFPFFLLGMLSHRIYDRFKDSAPSKKIQQFITTFYIVTIIFYQFIPGTMVKELFVYASTALCIPFIFLFTKDIHFDRLIGDLSFPIYLSHGFIIYFVRYYYKGVNFTAITIIITLIFSMLVNHVIMGRLEAYRQRRVALRKRISAV